jgi:pimeloyl-ACP methyl ester carboxylesterase
MTWLLLRGLARESRHWGDFTQQLASSTGQAVVTLDMPGNGAQCAEASPASADGLLNALRRQLDERGVALPVNVLAVSLGGMLATHWAQRYPQEVTRLVLINTSMRPFSGLTERLRPGSWLPLAKLALYWHQTDRAEQIESTIHQLTCQHRQQASFDIAEWSQIRRSAPVSAHNALRQLWAAARFTCKPAPPVCPVLVLSSKVDALVNPACSSRLAKAWQTPQHQHPWAGHDLPHDDGPWVCEQVLAWLAASVL